MALPSDSTSHDVAAQRNGVGTSLGPSPRREDSPGDLLQLGFVAQLCLAAVDVDQALQLACRFSPIWSSRHFEYQRTCGAIELRAGGLPERCHEHTFDTLDLTLTWTRLVHRLSGGAAAPSAVGAPACCRQRLRLVLHCPIEDTSRELTVRFAIDDIGHKNRHPDPGLVRLLAAHGERRLVELEAIRDTRTRARRALGTLMEQSSTVRVQALARELGLGVRTLHRRLRAEGTCFRRLVAQHKLERSVSQLGTCAMSAKQVALELGFADPASFHRAFKRWTGQTVGQYRGATSPQLEGAWR